MSLELNARNLRVVMGGWLAGLVPARLREM